MTETIKWDELTPTQRDVLMAENVFGWQWIPAEAYGPHVKPGTCWLLPENGLMGIKSDLSAEWTDIGDGKFIPRHWIAHYTTSWDAAMLAYAQAMRHADKEVLIHELLGIPYAIESQYDLNVLPSKHYLNVSRVLDLIAEWTPQSVCRAIAAAYGVQISDERSKQS